MLLLRPSSHLRLGDKAAVYLLPIVAEMSSGPTTSTDGLHFWYTHPSRRIDEEDLKTQN